MDDRISRAVKAGLLHQRAPVNTRFQLMRAAASGSRALAGVSSWGSRSESDPRSSERWRLLQRQSMEGRKYGYIVVTATFRLAW